MREDYYIKREIKFLLLETLSLSLCDAFKNIFEKKSICNYKIRKVRSRDSPDASYRRKKTPLSQMIEIV